MNFQDEISRVNFQEGDLVERLHSSDIGIDLSGSRRVSRGGGRGEVSLALFQNFENKYPNFGKKCP